jgi:hypothetical protein
MDYLFGNFKPRRALCISLSYKFGFCPGFFSKALGTSGIPVVPLDRLVLGILIPLDGIGKDPISQVLPAYLPN